MPDISDHTLLIVSTVFAAIGALADLTIVVLMIRGEPQRVGVKRRYWPWLLAMLLVTLATVVPAYLTYRLATGTLTTQTPESLSHTAQATSSGVPVAQSTVKWSSPRPRELAVDWEDFYPSWPLDLEHRFMGITKPCILKISAVQEHMKLRDVLRQIASEQVAAEIPICTIADDEADKIPSDRRDLDAMPIPPSGLSIHWNKDAQPQGELIAYWFENIGFIVHRGHILPPKSEATEIWIDIGPGFLWNRP